MLTLIFVGPLLWMVITSLKTHTEAPRIPPTWFRRDPTSAPTSTILTRRGQPGAALVPQQHAGRHTANVLVLVTASMAAYALARLEFRGRGVFGLIVATLFVPPVILIIPNFLIVDRLGWLDTLTVVIVPGAASAFGVFFLRQFFLSLPKELEEAALLDGANQWQIFCRSCCRCPGRRWRRSRCWRSSATGTTSCGRCTCCSAPRA